MNYTTATANAENRDAFVQVVDLTVNGALSQTVFLKRPFAQINIGTTDWKDVEKNTNVTIKQTGIEVATYSTFYFNGQSVANADATTATFALADMPDASETFPSTTITGIDKYLSMNYVLVGSDKSLVDVKINYGDDTGAASVQSRTFAQVPVQRNYRTNIYGALITSEQGFSTEIAPQFVDEHPYDAASDLAVGETALANCYIVSKAGEYMFPAIYMGNDKTKTINKATIKSAKVLWESFGTATAPEVGDLISDVVYENGYVYFTAKEKEGNAVIAVYDGENGTGTILWSWHIWLTDAPQAQVYRNNAGTMLDRNLGATSATPSDGVLTHGLFYQWGRKDPFLGSASTTTNTKAVSTGTWETVGSSDTSSEITIEYAVANPTTFIYNDNNAFMDWLSPNRYKNDEGNTVSSQYYLDNFETRWGTTKTIYDPCPAGYRVPEGSYTVNTIWSNALGVKSFTDSNADYSAAEANKGIDFASTTYTFVDGGTCWYPATGMLNRDSGELEAVGLNTDYWTCMSTGPRSQAATVMYFAQTGTFNGGTMQYRAYGLPVRCVKE